ncbi:hypothetical protein M2347_000348 [Chryseobacterium sp. H1D6B]|uniref:hypothetical protein n=1 Tax=Chryseobacterium sp. H1D6B TaxID=2940588 RepID=UPI0015CBE579|nr:hypothetical protein [Chryseobacterium sp. H1D6B]MDH6250621.1 hypothetical protein [Chryseobacterium sp. H1D6B]
MNTKYTLLYILIFVISFTTKAQVGIGTLTPDTSTILDLASSNKGLLIPRVQLSGTNDTTTVSVASSSGSPDQGMLVYNLLNAGISPNNVLQDTFYIWTGTAWEAIGEVADTRTEINNRNTTQILFAGSPAASTIAYTPAAYTTWTTMNFSTEIADNGNVHNNGTFTAPATGLYSFSGIIQLSISVTGGTAKTFGAQIINTTTSTVLATSYFGTGGGGSGGSMPIFWMGVLTAGTQVQIQYRMRDTAASNMSVSTNSNISMRKHF